MIEATCAVSAALFFFSNVLGFSFFDRNKERGDYTWHDFLNLDTDLIQHEFEYLQEKSFFDILASVLSAAAWMLLCVPILLYAHHQSLQGTFALSTNVTIAVLALGGSISEILSRLILIGATSTCNWMARKFNLDTWIEVENGAAEAVEDGLDEAVAAQQGDMIGWRVLELLYTFSHGLIVWIDSAEWSFLATIMVLIYIDVHKAEGTKFSRSWARFSLVIGIMAFFHFSSNVFHLHKWITYAPFAILLSLITKLFLLPVWLVWLGVQLTDHKPHATALPHSELSRCAVNGSDDDEGATAFT